MKSCKPILYLFFLFTFTSLYLSGTINAQEFRLPYLIEDVTTCDIDQDSHQDIIFICQTNEEYDSIYIFYNDGVGNFEITSLNRSSAIFIIAGDLDNDSIPDLLSKDGQNFHFIKNHGDRTYDTVIPIFPTNSYKVARYIADMDNDGLNDIVYTNSSKYANWGVLKNFDSLNFIDVPIYDAGIGIKCWPIVGHLNNDNLLDVTISYPDSGTIACLNQGKLTFTNIILDSIFRGSAAILEIDTVFPSDILIVNHDTEEIVLLDNLVYRNSFPYGNGHGVSHIDDFDQDGFDDYFYTRCWWNGCTDSIYVMINNRNWSFRFDQQYYVDTMRYFKTESADLNGDSFPDLVLTGFQDRRKIKILWNDGFGSFTPLNPVSCPEMPSELSPVRLKASPNPFSNSISVTILTDPGDFLSKYNVFIRNIYGQVISHQSLKSLGNGSKTEFVWDGKMQNGREAPAGLYIVNLKCPGMRNRSLKVIKF
jgi:hypothetical protein